MYDREWLADMFYMCFRILLIRVYIGTMFNMRISSRKVVVVRSCIYAELPSVQNLIA
jgi:hypothetical protein